jgi:phosphohistidine swiveling domain-containing protein
LAWSREINRQDWSKLSDVEIQQFVADFSVRLAYFGEKQFYPFIALEGPVKEVEKILSDKYNNAQEILQWIAEPYAQTKMTLTRIELLEMVRDGRIRDVDVAAYTDTYAWLPMYQFIDTPMMPVDVKKQIDLIDDAQAELLALENGHKRALEAYHNFLEELEDGELKKMIEITHMFSYLKEMRDDYRRPSYYAFIPFWQEISKRTGLSIKETNYLLERELIEFIGTKNTQRYKHLAKKRQKVFSIVLDKGTTQIFAADISERYLGKQKDSHVNELNGTVACRGIVRGRVCVVFHQGEFEKFVEGDVLVTTMTHPEFLSVMKQASAIVTDEGGITCHAAIVARELGKPCIIGTKIGTKVFKDGDMVEVDAERGVVKKI